MSLLIIALAVLVAVLIIGVPIWGAFLAAALTIVVAGGYDPIFLVPHGYKQVSSIILLAIPMFVLAGKCMERGGIGESLVNLVEVFVGRIKGGLGVVMAISCALFGAISGSGYATISCIGAIMLPRMEKAGYPKGHSAALIASCGVLGLLIPPSINMIMFAWIGGQSILASFASTIIPGIILVIFLSIVNLFLLRNNTNIKIPDKITPRKRLSLLTVRTRSAIPALLCPVIILGGIYGGFMTPTEAAAVAVFYSIPVGIFIYKGLNRKSLYDCLVEAASTTGVIMIMLLSVMMLSRLYTMENIPVKIMDLLLSITDNPHMILLMINIFLIIVGMLMDDGSAILLTTPIILPIVIQLGISPVQYAAIMAINLGLGCQTPPCAPFLYFGARVGNASVTEMLKPGFAFMIFAWIPVLILTICIPELSMWIPHMLGLI